MTLPDIYVPAGSSAHGRYTVDVGPGRAGWAFCGLRVLVLGPGESETVATGDSELLVLPLAGAAAVAVDGADYALEGRKGVFSGVTDYLYVGRGEELTITSAQGGRFALPAAVAARDLPVAHYPKSQVRVDLRGAGDCSRQVNNYALNNGVETSHLLCCEVLTPGGNWSSYPPHKHDEHNEVERILEEIYYYEVRPGLNGSPGMALQRIYPSGHDIDVCAEVHSRDVVTMPHGYHGPSVAAPGYDLYYLNVMAGPAEDSTWLMTDDPAYTWIRDTWASQDVDPRLPMTPLN